MAVAKLKISVVMPSYNHAEFIRAALDSVLAQQGDFQLEVIVVDGQSTDGTVEILKEYGDAIRWRSEPDDGQSDALNKGLSRATGDIIGWLNSDDLYAPGCLAAVCRVFEQEPDTQWLYGKVRIVDRQGREIRRWITWYKNCRMRKYDYRRLLAENWISQMGVFWRRGAGERVGPIRQDLHLAMDYDYWLRLGAQWPGRFVDQYLAAFRWYASSKTGHDFVVQTREALQVAVSHAGPGDAWPLFWHRVHRARTIALYRLMRLF